ncbi:MAG: hypothetical protein A4E44_01620 [Methanosaeta sp. PtaB.Bin018]|jgi:hypothetical protein|nr:MAG: hypothetical protein A4E44_01620 [Methanosaeta sp. PtaB.Bin018]OPY45274.1 MAG: hypothetical protein A4E46_01301 [Methanosaeta sp. PtaU1.Bin016]
MDHHMTSNLRFYLGNKNQKHNQPHEIVSLNMYHNFSGDFSAQDILREGTTMQFIPNSHHVRSVLFRFHHTNNRKIHII